MTEMHIKYRYVLLVLLFLVGGCGTITVTPEKMRSFKEDVKACMGVTQEIPSAIIQIEETDHVICNGLKRSGCFQPPRTIVLPRNTTENVIKHEWVHYILFATTQDSDTNHKSEYFLRCAGLILE